MCGRFALFSDANTLKNHYRLASQPLLLTTYNAAPGQNLPIVTFINQPVFQLRLWGLAPAWAPDSSSKRLINARAETITQKTMFSRLLAHNRCLVPANGFYEWSSSSKRQPYYFSHPDSSLFSFAGLTDSDQNSFAIITTYSNTTVSPIHNRMPVILSPEAESIWLNPSITDFSHLIPLLQPYPSSLLKKHPVSPQINRINNNNPDLIKPF